MARKGRGPFGCLFRFIFNIIIFVAAVVGLVAFLFYDGVNETPVALYTDDVVIETEVLSSVYQGLDALGTQNKVEVAFTEDQINRLIYFMIRDSMNPNYAPGPDCVSAACANVETISPMEIAGFKTRAHFAVNLVTVGTNIELRFDSIGIGKIKLDSGIGKSLMQPIMQMTGVNVDDINDMFEEKNLPIELDLPNLKLVFKQEDLPDVMGTLLPSGDDDLVGTFLNVLIENSSVELAFVGSETPGQGKLSLAIDLETLSLEEGNKDIPSYLGTPFDQTAFVTNQTQALLLSTLIGNPRFIFLQSDFNKMIYEATNGFADFGTTIELPDSEQEFSFALDAIWFEMSATNFIIVAQIDINGFITRFRIVTDVVDNNSQLVKLVIQDQLDIGYDPGELAGEYATAPSAFLINMIGPSIEEMNVMGYDPVLNAFILDTAAFNEMLNLGGTSTVPISAQSISIKDGRIEIEISSTDSALSDALDTLTGLVETVLGDFDTVLNDNIDLFDTTGDQADAVSAVSESIETIAAILNNPEQTLSEEEIEDLLNNINELTPENQAVVAELLAGELDGLEDGELDGLYGLLFGSNP